MNHNEGTVELTQLGLIDRINDAMGLNNATEVETLAEYGALPKIMMENPVTLNSIIRVLWKYYFIYKTILDQN